jgi:hypothetical protein
MAHSKKRLEPNYTNTDPYRGLPPNFPTMHSRYPAVPSDRYGTISRVTEPTDDAEAIATALKRAKRAKPSTKAKRAWRDVTRRIANQKKQPTVKS